MSRIASLMDGRVVQYGVFPNCTGNCDFCLRADRRELSLQDIVKSIRHIRDNLDYVDWSGQFSHGISLLGGEVYGYDNPVYEEEFMLLIDDIIEKVLKKSPSPNCRYSTVTNGMYDPTFLYRVCDRIIEACGIKVLDINFSYDLKYRYHTEERRQQALANINAFYARYNYTLGVQMILTQHVIESVNNGSFVIKDFLEKEIPGNILVFLYPHPVHTGKVLPDFFFKRLDFLNFLLYLEREHPKIYSDTVSSTYYSGIYKYGGLYDKNGPADQAPILTDGKELISQCGHSKLYRCYSNSNRCILCDILKISSFARGLA